MSRPKKKKLSKKTRWIILGSVAAGLVTAVLLFWNLFYIREVEVVGNTRYTDEEIRDMAMSGFLDHNSVFLSVFRSHMDMEDVPFLESVDVEYLDRDTVRLFVTEKNPVGYIRLNGVEYYFDQDGLVLETVTEGSEGPSLSDLPLVEGLGCDRAAVGEKLSVKDDSVFNTIQALTRMIGRYNIQPDSVEFSDDLNVTLHYGNVRVNLGKDSALEEKMIRVAAILPKLEGMSGVLHLEDFAEDTQNIVFSQDADQTGGS